MSRTFSIRSGSVDSLKLSLRCGRKPKARQIRATLLRLRPTRFASDRVLQCVASRGLLSSVSVTAFSTAASLILRGAPGRGSSRSPSTPLRMNRERQRPTVRRDIPRRLATSLLFPPSAHDRMMRAREASACAVLRRRTQRSSSARCSALTINAAFGRPVRIAGLLVSENAAARDIVSASLGQDTRLTYTHCLTLLSALKVYSHYWRSLRL